MGMRVSFGWTGRISLGLAATVAALAGLGTGSALAASEFGDTCAADDSFGSGPAPLVAYEVSHPENPLPTAAPVSGVITR